MKILNNIWNKMKMAHPAFVLALLAILQVSAFGATTTPAAEEAALPSEAREFLEAHNQARAAVGVEPLRWSEKLANGTAQLVQYQRDNKGCQFADSTGETYGANQEMMWGGTDLPPRRAVEDWAKEKNYYNYTDNSCAPNQECGNYKQVVWRASLEVGCAQASCVKEKTALAICYYNPPGDFRGERPYRLPSNNSPSHN